MFIYERIYGSIAAVDIVLKKANWLEIVEKKVFFLRRIPLAKSADKSLAPSWGGAGDYRDNHDHYRFDHYRFDHYHFDHYHFDHYRFDHLTMSIDIIFMISLKGLTKLANL